MSDHVRRGIDESPLGWYVVKRRGKVLYRSRSESEAELVLRHWQSQAHSVEGYPQLFWEGEKMGKNPEGQNV